MRRYRVRSVHKTWKDKGPDLLRTRVNAAAQALSILDKNESYSVRKSRRLKRWGSSAKVGRVGAVRDFLDDALPTLSDGQQLQVLDSDGNVEAVVRAEDVKVQDLSGGTPRAEQTWALIHHQFGVKVAFAGCFVCKRLNGDPNADWSTHAWGDAVDGTPRTALGGNNDKLFDWEQRMASEGLLPIVQVIGSRNGKVVSAQENEGWRVDVGGTSSHLWHNHSTCGWHSGTPPCAR